MKKIIASVFLLLGGLLIFAGPASATGSHYPPVCEGNDHSTVIPVTFKPCSTTTTTIPETTTTTVPATTTTVPKTTTTVPEVTTTVPQVTTTVPVPATSVPTPELARTGVPTTVYLFFGIICLTIGVALLRTRTPYQA